MTILREIKKGLIIGITVILTLAAGGIIYAAWNDVVSDGDVLTATKWNELVIQVSQLEAQIGNIGTNTGNSSGSTTNTGGTSGTESSLTWSNVSGLNTGNVTLATSGNVGIGTTSPTTKLDVNGKIRMRSQTTSGDTDDTVATKGYVDSKNGLTTTKWTGHDVQWDESFISQCPTGYVMTGVTGWANRYINDFRIICTRLK